jgi:hypothetical protein
MTRFLASALLFLAAIPAEAQQQTTPTCGLLAWALSRDRDDARWSGFREGLRFGERQGIGIQQPIYQQPFPQISQNFQSYGASPFVGGPSPSLGVGGFRGEVIGGAAYGGFAAPSFGPDFQIGQGGGVIQPLIIQPPPIIIGAGGMQQQRSIPFRGDIQFGVEKFGAIGFGGFSGGGFAQPQPYCPICPTTPQGPQQQPYIPPSANPQFPGYQPVPPATGGVSSGAAQGFQTFTRQPGTVPVTWKPYR